MSALAVGDLVKLTISFEGIPEGTVGVYQSGYSGDLFVTVDKLQAVNAVSVSRLAVKAYENPRATALWNRIQNKPPSWRSALAQWGFTRFEMPFEADLESPLESLADHAAWGSFKILSKSTNAIIEKAFRIGYEFRPRREVRLELMSEVVGYYVEARKVLKGR